LRIWIRSRLRGLILMWPRRGISMCSENPTQHMVMLGGMISMFSYGGSRRIIGPLCTQ
jgi:hypothetical protein